MQCKFRNKKRVLENLLDCELMIISLTDLQRESREDSDKMEEEGSLLKQSHSDLQAQNIRMQEFTQKNREGEGEDEKGGEEGNEGGRKEAGEGEERGG
ncbi:Potassium voltage-gated channel subfamily F member 1 [Dissostichus eleginoides]|uniref:Potassium voltage-gated channel subfamily F member 1 n=1 Tax=Dissostichus eleginoides TaxID=100907 RepID=A0AAD9BZH2_DISEL|nr:Potassium voltage-gated channel subfamily F member 1 [Dissostichus eleginoides]